MGVLNIYVAIFYLVVGALYCFVGKKFYPILHGVICAFLGFTFFFAFTTALSKSVVAGIIVALLAAGLCGWGCFKAKRTQAFVLGLLFGGAIGGLFRTLFINWWNTSSTLTLVIYLASCFGFAIYSCFKPKTMIVQATAFIGAHLIFDGFTRFLPYTVSGHLAYQLVGNLLVPAIAVGGYFVQKKQGFLGKEDEDFNNADQEKQALNPALN
jgi:hypothetical protein